MITERIAEHISMAEAAQNWLRSRGSRVTDFRVFMRRPLAGLFSRRRRPYWFCCINAHQHHTVFFPFR